MRYRKDKKKKCCFGLISKIENMQMKCPKISRFFFFNFVFQSQPPPQTQLNYIHSVPLTVTMKNNTTNIRLSRLIQYYMHIYYI